MDKCRGCEAFPKCTSQTFGDTTCRYLRFSYGMDDRIEITNADRIREMSDEELAEYIAGIIDDANSGSVIYSNRKEEWLEWLKQIAEE